MKDPEAVRRRTLEMFTLLGELDGAEQVVMPVLLEAVMIVEAYRGARHQVSHLPELSRRVDALIRELEITERIHEWTSEAAAEKMP
ncbi:MAG: hypothetical protein JWN69_2077 [Alphaproteobacteria bacterium]|nr:hypothetical protein [Alphaproteobacteria bacterium]